MTFHFINYTLPMIINSGYRTYMHCSDCRSKTTIFMKNLMENLYKKFYFALMNHLNLFYGNMRFFCEKEAMSHLELSTQQISKMADPAMWLRNAGWDKSSKCIVVQKKQCDCKDKTQKELIFS